MYLLLPSGNERNRHKKGHPMTSPSINPGAECDDCGGSLRSSDSGHGICLYCRLPDLLDQQLFMVRQSILGVTDDPVIVAAIDAHREPGYDLGLPVLRPGDQAVSDDRLTLAQLALLNTGGKGPTLHIGIAHRDSTLDTWPRKTWMEVQA
jgi:hypothetical protein